MSEGPPIIDFSQFGLDAKENLSDEELRPLAEKLLDSFSGPGIAYLVNHGIDKEDIKVTHDSGQEFFNLPLETKKKYRLLSEDFAEAKVHGYTPPGTESVEASMEHGNTLDISEGMHIRPMFQKKWPDEDVSGLRPATLKFFKLCGTLSQRIARLLNIALNLQDPQAIIKLHRFTEVDYDPSDLKFMHYYPIPEDLDLPLERQRLTEHTDLTTFTLIFQDDIGGLEYKTEDGTWLPVPPVPGSIVINTGDIIEVLSAGKVLPVVHRVNIPKDPVKRKLSRLSILYIAMPQMELPLTCLDGSNKYEATTYMKMYNRRIKNYFKFDK